MRFLFVINTIFLSTVLAGQTALDSYIISQMESKHITGLSAVLVQDESVVWKGNYGLANRQTGEIVQDNSIFMLASVSKTITATAVMQLYEDGLLNLDENINLYLPFEVFNPNFPDSVITIKQLVTHTSSIRDNWDALPYFDGDSPIALGDFLFDYFSTDGDLYDAALNFYNYEPETHYNYCNAAVALAGYIVEVVSGIPFNEYCNQNIFEPLCMENTGWFLSEINTDLVAHPYSYYGGAYHDEGLYGYPDYPDGQLRTTAISLSKFMFMYMQYGKFNGIQILDSATVVYMLSDILPDVVPEQGVIFYSYTEAGTVWWGHNGGDSGVSTDMYFNPETNTGLIILTNGSGSHSAIWDEILDTWNDAGAAAVEMACDINFPLDIVNSISTSINLFPNPATDYIYIENVGKGNSKIYDVQGKLIIDNFFNEKIYISDLENGLYFLQLYDEQNQLIGIKKFIKQE